MVSTLDDKSLYIQYYYGRVCMCTCVCEDVIYKVYLQNSVRGYYVCTGHCRILATHSMCSVQTVNAPLSPTWCCTASKHSEKLAVLDFHICKVKIPHNTSSLLC